jgi:hypothetical protein
LERKLEQTRAGEKEEQCVNVLVNRKYISLFNLGGKKRDLQLVQ